jgi:hypothetical protein
VPFQKYAQPQPHRSSLPTRPATKSKNKTGDKPQSENTKQRKKQSLMRLTHYIMTPSRRAAYVLGLNMQPGMECDVTETRKKKQTKT